MTLCYINLQFVAFTNEFLKNIGALSAVDYIDSYLHARPPLQYQFPCLGDPTIPNIDNRLIGYGLSTLFDLMIFIEVNE